MRRRDFIHQTSIAGLALGWGSMVSSCEELPTAPVYQGKRLVLVRLDGGNDGLFSLFPREHDLIDARRPDLKKDALNQAILLKDDWLWKAELSSLLPFWERREMAILPFVGYPQPNTSHFVSSEIWEMGGTPVENPERTGWIGRLLDEQQLLIPGNERPVISLSEGETLFDRGVRHQGYQWQDNAFLKAFSGDITHWLHHMQHGPIHQEMLRQYTLMQWLRDIEPSSGFPETSLGSQLASVAEMIRREKPFKVFHVVQGGYDTHTNAAARLKRLYVELADALAAFGTALGKDGLWKNTLVFVYSEFGRTLDENANGGTDHGAAGLCLLLGDNTLVRQYTDLPWKLDFQTMAGEPYLLHQLDFRDLYRDFQEQWLLT